MVAGCASSASGAHRVRPTVLRWGLVGLPDVPTLDPALASDPTSIGLSSLIYGGLVRLDGWLRVRPDGAKRWTISRDGRVYTFYLRHNLRFPDGRAVTAADFAAAIRRSIGPDGSVGTASPYLDLIARLRSKAHVAGLTPAVWVVNATTLRITLIRPAAHFLAELAFPASYVPDLRLVDEYGSHWTDHAAGFGPFSVQSWRHSRYLILQRNPYYYGSKPALKRIVLRFYQQTASALTAYQAGGLDLVSGLQAGETASAKPAGIRRVPALALDYLAFNTGRLPFYRLHARQAFASVWTPRLVAQAMGDAAFPATGFLPAAFGVQVPPWHATGRGQTYLAQARYPHGNHFPPIALVVPQDARVDALARALQSAWRTALGLDLIVRQLNPSDYSRILDAHAFDVAIVRWGADYPDPQDFLGTQLGSSADNITGWTRRPYDSAIRLADSYAPTDPRRTTLFQQAARLAVRKVPLLPLDEPAQTAIISPDLTNLEITPLGTIAGAWARVHFKG
jgi:ABC-type transport system substrate-binding protein